MGSSGTPPWPTVTAQAVCCRQSQGRSVPDWGRGRLARFRHSRHEFRASDSTRDRELVLERHMCVRLLADRRQCRSVDTLLDDSVDSHRRAANCRQGCRELAKLVFKFVKWVRLPFAVRAIVAVEVAWVSIRRVAVEASRKVCCRGNRGLRKEYHVELFRRRFLLRYHG